MLAVGIFAVFKISSKFRNSNYTNGAILSAQIQTYASFLQNAERSKNVSSTTSLQTASSSQSDYFVNLLYLQPKDQPSRPDFQNSLKKEFNITLRNWYGAKLGKTWRIGAFKYYVSTKNSEDFARNAYDTAVYDLQYNLNVPLFPQDAANDIPWVVRPGLYTSQKEINVIYVQTNQSDCVYGTYYSYINKWGVSTEGGLHLADMNKTPGFDSHLPPWNTTDPKSPYYNWKDPNWIDPIKNPANSWHCYNPKDSVPNPATSLDVNNWYNLSMGVAAHEIGHTFGLDHPTSEPDWSNTVMGTAWINWPNTNFSNADVIKLLGILRGGVRTGGSPYFTVVCDGISGTCPLINPLPTLTPTPCAFIRNCSIKPSPTPTSISDPCRGTRPPLACPSPRPTNLAPSPSVTHKPPLPF